MHPEKIHQLLMQRPRILPFSSSAIQEMEIKEVISNAAGHHDDEDDGEGDDGDDDDDDDNDDLKVK